MNYRDTMLISPKTVKESGQLNVDVDDNFIAASIRTAQNIYLSDVIGKELVEKLQVLVYNKIMDVDDTKINDEENIAYATLLYDYLTDVLVWKSVIDLCMRTSFKIRNIGVVQNSDTNANTVDMEDIKFYQNYLETMYNHCLNRVAEFLCENKEAIPESTMDCDCKPERKYANVNLFLG